MAPVEMWDEKKYWFCLAHHVVEDEATRCRSDQRLGPYSSYDEATAALELARKRTEAWEADD
jgi:hypothetical protein